MKKFCLVLFISQMFFVSAFAQSVSPDAVIKDLYKIHAEDVKTGKDRIISGKNRKYLDKFFDKLLADLIWKDLTTHKNDVGVIDFDVFYNTQDPDIKNLSIGSPKISGTKATVSAKFTNGDVKETLNYQMVKRNSEWKIADISYGKESLLGYFKEEK